MKTLNYIFFIFVALVFTSNLVTTKTAAQWVGEEVYANNSAQQVGPDQTPGPPGSSPTAATMDGATLDARVYLPLVSVAFSVGMAQTANDVPVGLGGFEPHATVVNPRNPSNVVVSQGNQLRISNDFGATFPILVNVTAFPAGYSGCGDDVIAFDAGGRLWWSYLRCIDGDGNSKFDNLATDDITIVVQQVNPTTGVLVGAAIDVTPGNHFDDKQWIAADANPASPFAGNVYLHWTRFDTNPRQQFFSRCVNCATTNTFSAPASIASGGGEGFRHQSHITTGPNGDVYAAYHINTCGSDETDGDIVLMRDSNGGADLAVGGNPPAGVFKTRVFGAGGAEVTCNRQPSSSKVPKVHFLMQGASAPFIVADPIRPGNIYIIANDDPDNNAGTGDDGDVLLARSTDYGASFTVSRIDHAPQGAASLQVFPQGTIDQDGNLAVFWYDTRRQINNNGPDGIAGTPDDYWNLDVYATVSRDGAQTFSNDFRINDAPFDPQLGAPNFQGDSPPTFRIGEYNGLAAVDGIGYAAWTGNTVNSQQILFDVFSILGAFPDRFEPNESIDFAVAAALGSDDTYNEPGLTIHSATDVDFFKVVALHTGKLEAEIEFNERINDLDVRVLDQFGNIVTTGIPDMTQTGSSLKRLTIPVVQGEIYFVEVCDQNSVVCNPSGTSTFAPQSTYDLTIINRPAPVPFELDLRATSDTGSDDDNLTSDNTPTIQLHVDDADFLAEGIGFSPTNNANLADDPPGFKVQIYDNGNPAGFATPVTGQPGIYEFAFPTALPDGPHSITARVMIVDPSDDTATAATDHFVGQGGESGSLLVSIDTTAPDCSSASAPDLLDSSDDAGVNIDNITTIMAPAFRGTAEANVAVHILANGNVVGIGGAGADASDGVPGNGLGAYEVTVEPLADGVYDITAVCESDAGVISDPTPALQVTIANKVLILNGATADVLVNLANGFYPGSPPTVTGYPGIPGGTAGISGIPVVNLDVNGQALTILGSDLSDNLTFSPTGPQGGSVMRAESPQILNLSGIGGPFTIDPGAGFDTLTVNGTVNADAIVATVDSIATVQVNGLQEVSAPIANTERLAISSDQGADTIDVTVFDTVNAGLYVDAGTPATTNPVGDVLNVIAGSASGHLQKQPGGPVTGSGSVFVTYPQTTDTTTRIDYEEVESVKLFK